MTNPDLHLLLHAALDGELDATAIIDIEQRLAEDPVLAAEYGRLKALRAAMRTRLATPAAPPHLRAQIAALGAAPPGRAARPRFAAMAAAAVLVAILSSGTTWLVLSRVMREASFVETLVDDHRRSLLAATPVDVVSSDRHTVKPWFDTHLALSPLVPDLTSDGFELLGGRVDVIDRRPVPTLVYRRREHVISVTALSAAEAADLSSVQMRNGYHVIAWRDAQMAYFAVSDLEIADLENFRRLFSAERAKG